MKLLLTFMASGSLVVDVASEEEARKLFEEDALQEEAAEQLAQNEIALTDVQEYDE